MHDWQNSAVIGINKRKAHVPLWSFRSGPDALRRVQTGVDDETCGRTYLSAPDWKFRLFDRPADVQQDFCQPAFDASSWDQIPVPSNWECEGHGTPMYTNIQYPWPVDPPFVSRDNPTGCYLRRFSLPSDWRPNAQRTFLVFEGVTSAFHCWLNGERVGYSQDSCLPAEFDVRRLLRPGDNVLAVQVLRWSDGSYLEDQDHWWLSGIHRDVYLLAKPLEHVADFFATTPLELDAESGAVKSACMDVTVHCVAPTLAAFDGLRVAATLYRGASAGGGASEPVLAAEPAAIKTDVWMAADTAGLDDRAAAGYGGSAKVHMDMASAEGGLPALWSSERPALYHLVVALVGSGDGTVVDAESCQVGFRDVKVARRQLLVNGQPVMMRGVNRHEHDERRGKAITEASMVTDIRLMKQLDFNAVRASHYPNHTRWYELCNQYGLFVIDEANVETHGFDGTLHNNEVNPTNDPAWLNAIVDRGVRMFERDKNHPCIIAWSLGNESGYGPAHLAMAGALRERDPSRPLHYEGGGFLTPATDIVCPMYARVAQIRGFAAMAPPEERRPGILCEYAHAMGNSTGGFKEYWDAFRELPGVQGGFIWDWVDQGLVKEFTTPNGSKIEGWAFGGDFGDSPHDANFCINGLCWPDRTLHPACWEVKAVQAPIRFDDLHLGSADDVVTVAVTNERSFVDTVDLAFSWRLLVDGAPFSNLSSSSRANADGWAPLQLEPVAPQGRTAARLGVTGTQLQQAKRDQAAGEAILEFRASLAADAPWAPAAHAVAEAQLPLPLGGVEHRAPELNQQPAKQHPPIFVQTLDDAEGGERVVVKSPGGAIRVEVSSSSGDVSVFYDGSPEPLVANMRPCFYRAPTDNDRGGSKGTSHAARWREAGLDRMRTRPETCRVYAHSSLVGAAAAEVKAKWTMEPAKADATAALDSSAEEVGGTHAGAGDVPTTEGSRTLAEGETATGSIGVEATLTVGAGGTVRCDWAIDARGVMPAPRPDGLSPSLARIGVHFTVPRSVGAAGVAWYGRGPHECYPDRQSGAPLRRHAADDVAALHVPYIMPGECGGRSDVRWLALEASEGPALAVAAARDSAMQINVSRYSLAALAAAKHEHELVPDDRHHVHLDAAHMGLGGDDSWSPSVLEEYRVPPKQYAFSYTLVLPVAGTTQSSAAAHAAQEIWRSPNAGLD